MDVHKRKREADGSHRQSGSGGHPSPLQSPRLPQIQLHNKTPSHARSSSQHQSHQTGAKSNQGAPGSINYLPRHGAGRLGLVQGDSDTFSDIVNLISEYEGVLERQESLAASLGAKLTGPRLLKGIEKFFDGPIKTNSPQPFANPISWIDVVTFAKSNPSEFTLSVGPSGSRCCQFDCKGVQVEINEDDWRLISSGALDRFPLEHPFDEDETAELATLDILEQRALILYKKADEVAARARILHHKLGHRKHDITRRRNSPEAGASSRFQTSNPAQRSAAYGPSYDLHADLLQQFISASASDALSRSTSAAGLSTASVGPLSPSMSSPHHRISGPSARLATNSVAEAAAHLAANSRAEAFRPLITQKVEKIDKGELITPPCDRCRRLRLQCVKHLTACQGCTKKHAKCNWRTVSDDELAVLRHEMGIPEDAEGNNDADAELSASGGFLTERQIDSLGRPQSEQPSRPGSRADTDVSMPLVQSPDRLQPKKFEIPNEVQRTSMPPGLGSEGGGHPGARDQPRLYNVSSLLIDSVYDGGSPSQSAGSILPPPSR